jgi:hypothetical protein
MTLTARRANTEPGYLCLRNAVPTCAPGVDPASSDRKVHCMGVEVFGPASSTAPLSGDTWAALARASVQRPGDEEHQRNALAALVLAVVVKTVGAWRAFTEVREAGSRPGLAR